MLPLSNIANATNIGSSRECRGFALEDRFLGSIRAESIVTDRRVHEVKNKESTGGSFPNEKSVDRLIDGTSVKKCSKGDREGLSEAFFTCRLSL